MKIPVFYSYAHVDDDFRMQLEIRLELLRRQNIIEGWSDRRIAPGSNWEEDINFNLKKAKIIILLISPDFLASDYCYETETIFALEQHEKGKAIVVPIIIRPCMWKISSFKHLQVLPRDGKALTLWDNSDEAWLNVSEGIFSLIQEMLEKVEQVSEEEQTRSIGPAAAGKPKTWLESINDLDLSTEQKPILELIKDSKNSDQLKRIEARFKEIQPQQSSEMQKVLLNYLLLSNDFPKDVDPESETSTELLLEKQVHAATKETLSLLLLRFLFSYNDWYFSPLRIQRWGARQIGFEKLENFSTPEIKDALEKLRKNGQVKVTKSKNGNPIYKLK
ncbi:MAG: toll/interleukin-1 receptor domain-containing protein [Saprospiraceae bacterium]